VPVAASVSILLAGIVASLYFAAEVPRRTLPRQALNMDSLPSTPARQTAEKILQLIYGDDFAGCAVSLDELAAIVDGSIKEQRAVNGEIIDAFKKVVEAVHALSTPPDPADVKDSKQLQDVLGTRLDSIREITSKTIKAIEALPRSEK
jgi:hypothetical protein